MKNISILPLSSLLVFGSTSTAFSDTVGLFFNPATPQHAFAAGDIRAALEAKKHTVEVKDLSALSDSYTGKKIVIALASDTKTTSLFEAQKGSPVNKPVEQAYALRTTTGPALSYWALGGDDNGAMYGALQVAENIMFKDMTESFNEDDAPHLKNRGIKFNIPLDKKSPTYFYDSDGTSHQMAVRHVWDITFWKTWFDEMARHRYNVLSLWSPHPFTSMVNMEDEYPGVAIQGVTGFDKEGEEVAINDWNIDKKIAFWKEVMKYGHERGFAIHIFNWNIFLSTAEGKHGIEEGPENQQTRTYLRKCTRKLFETYPHLTGIGVTVGENMDTKDDDLKEDWAWDTYGRGTHEFAVANPERKISFVHRLHQGDLSAMLDRFKTLIELPNVNFDISHKYSNAHAHAAVQPSYWKRSNLEPKLEKNGINSWLTVRNDDWYYLHWADPQFVRDYVNHFPTPGKHIEGINIGPDGWVFSRVFQSKDPHYESKQALEVQKTWYMQKIWGRITYNPNVADDLFTSHLASRYPGVAASDLFEAWSKASRALRLVNEQVTGEWSLDFHWWPERWTSQDDGYLTVKDLIETDPMDGSDLADVKETAKNNLDGKKSALVNAADIQRLADEARHQLSTIKSGSNHELALNLQDIEAMAHLSLFGASKIRAAVFLEQQKPAEAREEVLTAYRHWTKYADIMDANYIGTDLQRNHDFKSWHQTDEDILSELADIGGPVKVDVNQPYPWARIITPIHQTEIQSPADVAVTINAAVAGRKPATVELRSNGELIHTSTEASFTHTLKGLKDGDYSLSAQVSDPAGGKHEQSVSFTIFSPETKDALPWKEEFNQHENTVLDEGRTSWRAKRAEGVFALKDNALVINDKGAAAEFRSGEINIAGAEVNISLEITSKGPVDRKDYVRLYQMVDGEAEALIGEVEDQTSGTTLIKGTAKGNRLVLVIRASVSSGDENYIMDNLQVTKR